MVAGAFIGFYLVLTGTFFPLPISIALMGPMVADGLVFDLDLAVEGGDLAVIKDHLLSVFVKRPTRELGHAVH